jgi:hypothetical protein
VSVDRDNNFASFVDFAIIENRVFLPPPANPEIRRPTIDDVLKFSREQRERGEFYIRGNVKSIGGTENAADINNRCDVTVEHGAVLELVGGDQASLVVKGGSSLRTLGSGRIVIDPSPAAKFDLLIDDWSDQDQNPSTIDAMIIRRDGAPLRIAYGRRRAPAIRGNPVQIFQWRCRGMYAYNLTKGSVRWVLRYKQGQKGPF